jgi:hypothetical protein
VLGVKEFENSTSLIEKGEYSNAVTQMKYLLPLVGGGFYEDMDCFIKYPLDYFLQFDSMVIYRYNHFLIGDFFFYSEHLVRNVFKTYDLSLHEFNGNGKIFMFCGNECLVSHQKEKESSWVKKENNNNYKKKKTTQNSIKINKFQKNENKENSFNGSWEL